MLWTHVFSRMRWTRAIVAISAPIFMTTTATAQLFSPDPYDPYGRAYRAYAYPGAGYNPSLPNASRYAQGPNSPAAANQFQGFLNDPSAGLFSRSTRYDSAFRKYDSDFGRDVSPGDKADAKYFEERERREQAMIRAMVERDPKKRDELVRQAESEAKKAGSSLGPSVRRGASASGGPSVPPLRPRARSAGRTTAPAISSPASTPAPAATGPTGSAAPAASSTPPAPALPSSIQRRSPARTSVGRGSRGARTPSEVLNRSRRMEADKPDAAKPPVPPAPSELPR